MIKTTRIRYSEAAQKVMDIAIDHRRATIQLPPDAVRGARFNDDGAILARLESMTNETEFMACPGLKIDGALLDAAQADGWYATEKDYGHEGETEIVGDEDE